MPLPLSPRVGLLAAQWEASPDAVLAVDRERRVLLSNRRFRELQSLPADALLSGEEARVRAHVLSRMVNPGENGPCGVQMPEMDGFEATAALRRASCGAPIVAMTAYTMGGDRERCLAAGMDGYVAKPNQPADLHREIERFCPFRVAEATAA